MSSPFNLGLGRDAVGTGARMAGAGGPLGGAGIGGGMGLMGLGLLSGPIIDLLKPVFDKVGLDASQIAAILLTLGALRYLYSTLLSFSYLLAPFRSRATLRSTDELYPIVIAFLGDKIGESRHFEAQCLPGDKDRRSRRRGMIVDMSKLNEPKEGEESDKSTDDSDAEDAAAVGTGDKGARKAPTPKRVQKQANRLQFAPAHGTHYFFYRRHLVTATLSRESNGPYGHYGHTDTLILTTLSLDRSSIVLRSLIEEAYKKSQSKHHQKTMVYRAGNGGNGMVYEGNQNWQASPPRPSRPIESVAMDPKDRDLVIRDIDEYLSNRTARYYARRGIPYRRGYLFSGDPGTGKTSLSFALAGLFNVPMFVFDLSGGQMNDNTLMHYFSGLPKKAIVLIEDIDVALPGGQAQDRSTMAGAMANEYMQQQRRAKEKRKAQRLAMQERLTKMENALQAATTAASEAGASTKVVDAQATPSVNGVDATKDAPATLTTPATSTTPAATDAASQASSLPASNGVKRAMPVVQFVADESDEDEMPMPIMGMQAARFGPQRGGITLSGLLNAIDGVGATEQRILIMTSNHPERLDPALIRPGRVDVHIRFSLATPSIAKSVFESIYQDDASPASQKRRRWTDEDVKEWSETFASQIPSNMISPAELQGYLLMHKKQPKVAAQGVGQWIADNKKEKEKDAETLLSGSKG